MDTLLQVGDVFTSAKLNSKLYGNVAYDSKNKTWFLDSKTGEPYVDFSKLHTEDYDSETHVHWKETKKGGWYRDREAKLSARCLDPVVTNSKWKVIETAFTGGGCAHGPHDTYPDGHWVLAKRVGGSETVNFYQSGCFRGMILPQDIVKL